MNDKISSSVKNESYFWSILRNSNLSQSLSDVSGVNHDGFVQSESNSSDEMQHSYAVDRLRSKSFVADHISQSISDLSSSFSETVVLKDEDDVIDHLEEIKYDGEGRYSDQFKSKETHIFVLSQSGKPIFSRYGSDNQTAAFIGVMQAMLSFVESGNDKLRVMTAGEHNFVFVTRDNIILVAVSRGDYVPNQLRIMLSQVYHQIISTLTFRTIATAFQKQPSLDLRRLLGGIDRYLHGMIEYMEKNMGPLLGAVNCVTMQATLRQNLLNTISQAVKVNIKSLINDLVFVILLLDEELVGVVRRKDYHPHPTDLHIIMNLLRNSAYFKTQICWTPVCLPKFDPDGFFYAHISYLEPRLSLVQLTVNPEQFDVLQNCRDRIHDSMTSSGLFDKLKSVYSIDTLLQSYKLTEVRHFIYKMRNSSQCISFSSTKEDVEYNGKRTIGRYLRLHSLIHLPDRPGRLVYQSTDIDTIFAWQTLNFELYATLDRMNSKCKVMEVVNKLLDAINKQKNRLFITISPTF